MGAPRIYADFQSADPQGRIRLNCIGTTEDLAKQHIELRDGLVLMLYSDDLDEKGQLDERWSTETCAFRKKNTAGSQQSNGLPFNTLQMLSRRW